MERIPTSLVKPETFLAIEKAFEHEITNPVEDEDFLTSVTELLTDVHEPLHLGAEMTKDSYIIYKGTRLAIKGGKAAVRLVIG